MKLSYLIKATPLLPTLLIIIFLCMANQKEYTRLRILIWNTPTLKLGTYFAISSGTGFILSYLMTYNLSNLTNTKRSELLTYKEENKYQDSIEYDESNTNSSYDKTLIERDIKDPPPTINASFRIIGLKDRTNSNFINNNSQFDGSYKSEGKYNGQNDEYENSNQVMKNSSDWNDESYSKW